MSGFCRSNRHKATRRRSPPDKIFTAVSGGGQRSASMSAADAYALSSLAVDLGIGEAVDIVNLVYARIPKNIFKSNPEFWYKPDQSREANS